jgi:hypothetical protein
MDRVSVAMPAEATHADHGFEVVADDADKDDPEHGE